MKNFSFIVIAFLLVTNTNAQINFEPAYFINNADIKTNCFIRNVDWKNNPSSFEYKLGEDDDSRIASISDIKEFQVDNESRYVRAKVRMNRATDNNNALDTHKDIVFKEEEVFLKTLSEGDALLYYFEDNNLRRFFYQVDGSLIDPLIYKRYRKSITEIASINTFKQQLWNDLKCDGISRNFVNSVNYKIDDLVDLFDKYNACKDPTYANNKESKTKLGFNLSIRPGIDYTSLSITNTTSRTRNVDFDSEINFRLGVELEGILPFNKNKWGMFIEPTFHSFSSEKQTEPTAFNSNTSLATVNYKSIEIPMGLRHYMFLNDNAKLFANVGYVVDIPLNASVAYEGTFGTTAIEFGSNGSFIFGLGFKYNKIGVEARYIGKREVFGNGAFVSYFSDYQGYSLIFGYTLF